MTGLCAAGRQVTARCRPTSWDGWSGRLHSMLPILPRTDGNAGQLNGLLDHMTAPPPKYVAVRPDGRPWEWTFFSMPAAWRAVLKGS